MTASVGKRNKERGKEVERAMAELWGAERVSHTGQGTEIDDLRWPASSPAWSIEAKRWSPAPATWLTAPLVEAERHFMDTEALPDDGIMLGAVVYDWTCDQLTRCSGVWEMEYGCLSVRTKSSKAGSLPQRVTEALDQAEANCGKLRPIVVFHTPHQRYAADLVVMRYQLWRHLYGEFVGRRAWDREPWDTMRRVPLPLSTLIVTRARYFLDYFGS